MNTKIFALIRMVLSGFGAYLLGKNLFGHAIDETLWQEIVGGVMIAISFVNSILSKSSTYEMVEGFLRQLLTAVGGLGVGFGIINEQTLTTITNIVIAVTPLLLSLIGKKKSQAIATGELGVRDLAGVKDIAGTERLSPSVNTPGK